jgi:adenine-specific DNA-methyltransferase
VEKYEQVLSGHVNLYHLFLWWAIRATRPAGRLVFLVPQSIRSGQYSSRLRQEITNACDVTAITGFVDRTGVFDFVEQPMMVIALGKPSDAGIQKPTIRVRISANGQALGNNPELKVAQEHVVWTTDSTSVWCVSDKESDYGVMVKVCKGWTTLGQAKQFRILNGGFVWNQHTDRLRSTEDEATLPLISSVSIGPYNLTFPPLDKRVSARLFADASPPLPGPIYESAAILIKRTTPKIVRGRRIVAAVLFNDFLKRYPSYFAENHVNIVVAESGSPSDRHLLGLCAWLNSRLASFAFGMMNASSHLSKLDLSLVPLPVSLLPELGDLARQVTEAPADGQGKHKILDQIDERLFDFFQLSPAESRRVRQVVPAAV